jgi:hypothetical protein
MQSSEIWLCIFFIAKELMKLSSIAQEKLTLTRRELQEIVVLTSKLTTQLALI